MANITFTELMQAVQKLTPEQKATLRRALEASPTREQLIAELEAQRAAGVFKQVESMRNQYANPDLAHLTDQDLTTTIHDAATEWEQELDEFFGDRS